MFFESVDASRTSAALLRQVGQLDFFSKALNKQWRQKVCPQAKLTGSVYASKHTAHCRKVGTSTSLSARGG